MDTTPDLIPVDLLADPGAAASPHSDGALEPVLSAAAALGVREGLLFSQLLTLYITPVIYTYLDKFQHRFGKLAIFRTRG